VSHIPWRDNPEIPEPTAQQLVQLQELSDRVDESVARAYCADECDRRTCTGWERHMFGADSTTTLAWALGKGYLRLPRVFTAENGERPTLFEEITVEASDGTTWRRQAHRSNFRCPDTDQTVRNVETLIRRYAELVEIFNR
jgi:hypothetical protein